MTSHTKKAKAKISRKIRTLRKEGVKPKQAVAITFSISRKGEKRKKNGRR